ncbi:MAG: FAD-dependent oxidoreductase [Deltaproteobacteria bacterium]|nr:FAD-dependent oxidoreductase [Deltaproteobacteria bacterium]
MKIAIVGAGVSGLTAAHYLQRSHQVVLFEGERQPGGHTHTVDVMEGERPVPVDTGFIVFNTKTYPGFVRLLGELGVAWSRSDMSLSVRSERRNFEYSSRGLAGLFAQPWRAFSPRHWRMARDILRFYREAEELLAPGEEQPLGEWLRDRRYSDAFIEDHFIPLVRAVWSSNRARAEAFPARFLARFFANHGFLQLRNAPPWLSIPGGSRTYVRAILAGLNAEVRLGEPVRSVRRDNGTVTLRFDATEPETFDHVIFACHSDQALRLLEDPSPTEQALLGAIPYQANEVALHIDERLMPTRRFAWASWNAHLDADETDGACLTYWMNRLQPLEAKRNYFVTLNRTDQIRPDRVLYTKRFDHPIFSVHSAAAQSRHRELIGHRASSYCGAYWGNGFHEDGVQSALRVVEAIGAERQILDSARGNRGRWNAASAENSPRPRDASPGVQRVA